jgi:hypothetical protein
MNEEELREGLKRYQETQPPGYNQPPKTFDLAVRNIHKYLKQTSKFLDNQATWIEINALAQAFTLVGTIIEPKRRSHSNCLLYYGIYKAFEYLDQEFDSRNLKFDYPKTKAFNDLRFHHNETYSFLKKAIRIVESVLFTNEPMSAIENILELYKPKPEKLQWKGSPAEFGFLFMQLFENGWVTKPTKSYAKDGEILLNYFELETTVATLEKELNPNVYSLTINKENIFKISENKKNPNSESSRK